MRPWFLRILSCLFLGAATTVAGAWACARGETYTAADTFDVDLTPGVSLSLSPRLFSGISRKWGWKRTADYYGDAGWLFNQANGIEVLSGSFDRIVIYDEAGWPARALAGSVDLTNPKKVDARFALVSGLESTHVRLLPLRPLWPGFLIDTLCYGATWFGLFFGITTGRRMIRRRRGRCPKCGYDLRGHAHDAERRATVLSGCPECGWNRES